MRKIGYVRAKEGKQIVRQTVALIHFGAEEIVLEEDGKTLYETVYHKLNQGDKLYITSLDRISRDITIVANILEALYSKGVELIVNGEKYDLDTFFKMSLVLDQIATK